MSARQGRRAAAGFGRRGIVLLALTALLGVVLLLQELRESARARSAYPLDAGRIAVAGLREPVEIFRDARGAPHVLATSELDAYFGWGFAHAQDRLAQMLWLLSSARGRSAEIVGGAGVDADRWARTLSLGALADREFEHLDEDLQQRLIAYAAGVNAQLERIRDERVSAPLALRGASPLPDRWQPADSLAVLKLYSWGFADSVEVSLVLRDITAHLGSRAARPFFPRADDTPSAAGEVVARAGAQRAFARGACAGLERLRQAVALNGGGVGSSAWLLAGKHTESGFPILAADSHLEVTAPPLLHVAHVSGGALDAAGVALPGVPLFWSGQNRHVVWASTHARVATIDLYTETLGESDPSRYHDGKSWLALEQRVERIGVRGRPDEKLTVRSTQHGPLVDALLEGETEPLSLAWVGARSDVHSALVSLTAVAHARDAAELRAALAQHHEPPLTVAYADASGAGAVQVAAWIPVRALPTHLVPLPGRARWYDWQGRLEFEQLPAQTLRADRAWLIAADNALQPRDATAAIDWLWRPGSRADRIRALLESSIQRRKIDLRRMSELQADVGAQSSSGLIATALQIAGPIERLSIESQEIAQLLASWDGISGPESVGAAAYHVFVDKLAEGILDFVIGPQLAARYGALRQVDVASLTLELMRSAIEASSAVGLDTARVRGLIHESLRKTWLLLSFELGANRGKWRWGTLHGLSFRPFGAARAASDFDRLSALPYGGSGETINSGEFAGRGSFAVRVASAFRFVVDAGSPDQALVAIAPGQSEHPGHQHFRDGLADWMAGRSSLLVTDRLLVRESGARRLLLEPPQ